MYSAEVASFQNYSDLSLLDGDEMALRYCWRDRDSTAARLHLKSSEMTYFAPSQRITKPTSQSHDLKSHIFSLPQELFDMIIAFTFTVPTSTTISLDPSTYRTPPTLQVCSHFRKLLAEGYYLENQFNSKTDPNMHPFADSVPEEWREVVRRQLQDRWAEEVKEYWRVRGPPDVAFAGAWDCA